MRSAKNQSGVIQIIPLLVIALIVGAITFSSVFEKPDVESNPAVLSEDEDNSGSSSGSGSSGPSEERDDNDENEIEDEDSLTSGSSGSDSSGGDDDTETETEVRYPSGVRVRTREREGEQRVDIYEGGRHLRIRTRDGVTTVTVENEEGEELEQDELTEGEEVETEATGGARIRIRSAKGRILLRQGLVSAQTDFPVSVDQETGELTITTPAGVKVVAVLPEEAVNNMLATNVIDRVLSSLPQVTSPSPLATDEGELEDEAQSIEIEEEDGEVVYHIEGVLEQRFLGLFNVLIPRTAVVSAQTGEVIEIRQPIIDRILDLLSF